MLDPNEVGCVDQQFFRELLQGIMELSQAEMDQVMSFVPKDEDGQCLYEDVLDGFEGILQKSLFKVQWNESMSDVELYVLLSFFCHLH